ncbi:MAG: ATP-binding cassette domain-containing protein [Acidimicrobiales bacterium]
MHDTDRSAPPVQAHGLVREFGDLRAVDGIDLSVEAGEIFGFLGPNGAGKSTTVRMLVTLLKPTAGTARVAGYDVVGQPTSVRRSIGVALQDAAIDPLMTGNELLRLQAVLHGMGGKKAHDRCNELLERVGLTAAGDRRVGTYSGGMRRRLDLALALIHRPVVLFLDEPTTGLDPTSRLAVWDEVRALNDEGTTVFLTTQYLEEADQLAGRVAIIDGGRIVREGDPARLKEQVGEPTLRIEVADPARTDAALAVLTGFGEQRPARAGRLAIGLRGGAATLADVVRALDDAQIAVGHVELDSPSLDDVFADATGRRLEGAESGA